MLRAPGMCPARCAVSVMPGGAMMSPTNSAGERTSTSATFLFLSARSTSGRLARSVALTFFGTGYLVRSEEHTSELQSRPHLVCRLLLEKKTSADTPGAAAGNSEGKLREEHRPALCSDG